MPQETFLALLGGRALADDPVIQDGDSPNGKLAVLESLGSQGQALSHDLL